MDSLNQIEIQNIRHICGHSTNFCDKITYYKTLTEDTKVTDTLDNLFNSLNTIKQDLSEML